jgi:hypothetical protein
MGSYNIACGLSGIGLGSQEVILVPLMQRSLGGKNKLWKDGCMPVFERIEAYHGSPCNGLYQFCGGPRMVFLGEDGNVDGELLDTSCLVLHPEIYKWCLSQYQKEGRAAGALGNIKSMLKTTERLKMHPEIWDTSYVILSEDEVEKHVTDIEAAATWISHLAAIAWGYYCARRILLPSRGCSSQDGEQEFMDFAAKVASIQEKIIQADQA